MQHDRENAIQPDTYVMPVLQGLQPQDYLTHLQMYGSMLLDSSWVGIGSLKGKHLGLVEEILRLDQINETGSYGRTFRT